MLLHGCGPGISDISDISGAPGALLRAQFFTPRAPRSGAAAPQRGPLQYRVAMHARSFSRGARRLLLIGALAGASLPGWAQYKIVAPDGRVTYTDRPALESGVSVSKLQRSGVIAESSTPPLPIALRQAAERYPVTLFSAAECAPCDAGRMLLRQRGVPFTEKLIVSEDDALEMERALGARTVPSLTIGKQALRGLSEAEWAAYLDAAGYPRESALPKTWQAAPAVPLAQRRAARAAAPAVRPNAAAPAASAPAAPSVAPPPGIRF